VEAVLFDYGVTLVAFERPVDALEEAHEAVAACIAAAGQSPPPTAVLTAAVHDRVEAAIAAHAASGALDEIDVAALEQRAFTDLGLHLDGEVRDRCSVLIQEAWWRGARVHADVWAALGALRDRGLRIGVCSNAPYRPASMHAQIRHIGLGDLIDAAVFSGEVGWRKPSPRLFAAALDALRVTAARTVCVGDQVREDVDGAAAMGMRTVLVVRDGDAPAGCDRAGATVRSLAALPALLDETRL
jgi:HAD superfamily hydrolase (TIGR01509 family)